MRDENAQKNVRRRSKSLHIVYAHLPVENVEEAVEAERGDVVAGQVLDDAHLVEHDDLGDEGDRLEPDREGPEPGPGRPPRVQDAGQHGSHRDQDLEVRELVAERVVGGAVGHLVLHEVDDERCGRDEEDLHRRVVDADEVHEEVRVAHQEHDQVDLLRLA